MPLSPTPASTNCHSHLTPPSTDCHSHQHQLRQTATVTNTNFDSLTKILSLTSSPESASHPIRFFPSPFPFFIHTLGQIVCSSLVGNNLWPSDGINLWTASADISLCRNEGKYVSVQRQRKSPRLCVVGNNLFPSDGIDLWIASADFPPCRNEGKCASLKRLKLVFTHEQSSFSSSLQRFTRFVAPVEHSCQTSIRVKQTFVSNKMNAPPIQGRPWFVV